MLTSYLNALYNMETCRHKEMMHELDENVDKLYSEFENQSFRSEP